MQSLIGTKWFIANIDDHTRICWVCLMREKSGIEGIFKKFHNIVKTQFHKQIQILSTDNGREYFNTILGPFLTDNGIVYQSYCLHSP